MTIEELLRDEREQDDINFVLDALRQVASALGGEAHEVLYGGAEQTQPYISLRQIDGLEGPKDLTSEYYREYDFLDEQGLSRTYRISDPIAFYNRPGGSTHRVVDREGVVHCVPAPGQRGCVLRWKNRGVEQGADPVAF